MQCATPAVDVHIQCAECGSSNLLELPLYLLQEAANRVSALCDGEAEGKTCGALYSRRAVVETPGPAEDAAAAAALWQQSCKDADIQQYLLQ
jgi:hypothetical protein